jgi:hypothetical protein
LTTGWPTTRPPAATPGTSSAGPTGTNSPSSNCPRPDGADPTGVIHRSPAGLVRDLASTRRGHATIGSPATTGWLFPGGLPGRSLSPFQLAERLRQLGLNAAQSRSTALFQLATELPAAVLARTLGIHIAAVVTWQRASAGDWTGYAAEVSRRTHNLGTQADETT